MGILSFKKKYFSILFLFYIFYIFGWWRSKGGQIRGERHLFRGVGCKKNSQKILAGKIASADIWDIIIACLHEHLLIGPLKVPMQGFFDSLIFSPQNPRCNDFFENFHKILIPCLESRVMKLMTRNLVEIEANLWHGISDSELMTRSSTNNTELFRKMTSLIIYHCITHLIY